MMDLSYCYHHSNRNKRKGRIFKKRRQPISQEAGKALARGLKELKVRAESSSPPPIF